MAKRGGRRGGKRRAGRRSSTSGFEQLAAILDALPSHVTDAVTAEMARGAHEIRTEIERTAPRDHGAMARAAAVSITDGGLRVRVGYSKQPEFLKQWRAGGWYAVFVEFGSRRRNGLVVPARPFVRPAFRRYLPTLRGRIKALLVRAVRAAADGKRADLTLSDRTGG